MGIAFRFAARSDVGRVRSKNDDSGYAGHYLAVVADGMGGHAGGDVASATTVLDLTPLDHSGFNGSAGIYLADEITTANIIMNELVDLNPTLAGMGTTCTALLVDGHQIELAHIGDSRAYRLRDGGFEQITTDHTFVQRLLEEGRISAEEALHHPHKNVVMRVLGDVDASPELETKTLDAEIGEKWVLSSDGLDTVLSLDEIEAVMRSTEDLSQITETLVNLTLERGAPDNVTVVTLAVIDEDSLAQAVTAPQSTIPVRQYSPDGELVGEVTPVPDDSAGEIREDFEPVAADNKDGGAVRAPWRRRLPESAKLRNALHHGKWRGESFSDGVLNMMTESAGLDKRPDDVADSSAYVLRKELDERPHLLVGAAATATNTGMIPTVTSRTLERRATLARTDHPDPVEDTSELPVEIQEMIAADPAPRRAKWPVRIFTSLLILAVLVASVWTFFAWASDQYYVGVNNSHVAVYNGIPQSMGPLHFYEVVDETDLMVDDLPEYSQSLLRSTITADDRDDAERIIADLEAQAAVNYQVRGASQTPSEKPSASPSPSVSVSSSPSPSVSEVPRG